MQRVVILTNRMLMDQGRSTIQSVNIHCESAK